MEKEYFNLKIYHIPIDVKNALLKINDFLTFCNLTNYRILVSINDIKEKLLLIESSINNKATYFVTKIVIKHN